jgi:hypothetical protein
VNATETNGNAMTTTNGGQLQPTAQLGEMSVQAIVDRKRKLVEVMQAVMEENVHYGKIPGCGDKPTLHKAGAEVLATVFGLAPHFKITRTDMPGGHREYEIVCTLKTIGSGLVLGEGVGTCSTMESKYRWRQGRRACPECGSTSALFKSKKPGEGFYCWTKKDGCGAQFAPGDPQVEGQNVDRVENPDVADTYNTVLKMAKKRAQVDATLTAVGASDILTQDLEDLPAGSRRDEPIEDAEFTDRPASNGASNGNTRPPRSNGPDLEAIAMDLIADIEQAKSPDEVRKLAPRFGALPKGSAPRANAYAIYQKRIAATTAPEAA